MKKIAISSGKGIAAVVFWVAVWFVIALLVDEKFLVPTPQNVLRALGELIVTPLFWKSTAASLARVMLGVAVSFVIGCGIAWLISKSKIADTLISPLLSIIKATPVACFIVIIWVWVDNTSHLPALIASLIVIPIVTSNVLQGLASVDKCLLEVTRVYKFSPFKRLYSLYIPTVAPYILAACRSSLGMAWKASVAAEMIVLSKNSIGKEIYNTKLYSMEEAPVFAWTIVVIILSVIIEKLIIWALNRLGHRLRVLPKGERYAEN